MKHKHQVYQQTANDQLKEPMFFGTPVNVARYDQQRFPIFEKLTERQMSTFWRPEEINVTQDKHDFVGMSEQEKHIFVSTLSYQILLDSVQGRSPVEVLLPICSNPELESSLAFILAPNTEYL